jgi:hypothetical protein
MPDRSQLRRVLIGVVAGLVALALGFSGWVDYRQSQYRDRERTVLTRYHSDLAFCLTVGNADYACVRRVLASCEVDPFWLDGLPFATAGSAPPDRVSRCSTVAVSY